MKDCLIIFTRYPEPGKTKTRLIPVLGAEGAAKLQRQMTEQKLAEAKKLQAINSLFLEIHFTDGNQQLMQNWLGNLTYKQQSPGDIGYRMAVAFQTAFEAEMSRVVLIGIDCPDLKAELMVDAFQALNKHDLVLGPATDGGYYLIGLNYLISELFIGITWSTAKVLEQTKNIAQKLELAVAYLPTLSDIDRPEDLAVLDSDND
ncbi:MAG: TIGR04282 family arsenosugar biosynthesis glycosyltransferase [Coleofasciculaceae cyanobacterium]